MALSSKSWKKDTRSARRGSTCVTCAISSSLWIRWMHITALSATHSLFSRPSLRATFWVSPHFPLTLCVCFSPPDPQTVCAPFFPEQSMKELGKSITLSDTQTLSQSALMTPCGSLTRVCSSPSFLVCLCVLFFLLLVVAFLISDARLRDNLLHRHLMRDTRTQTEMKRMSRSDFVDCTPPDFITPGCRDRFIGPLQPQAKEQKVSCYSFFPESIISPLCGFPLLHTPLPPFCPSVCSSFRVSGRVLCRQSMCSPFMDCRYE